MVTLAACEELEHEDGRTVAGMHWVYMFDEAMMVMFDSDYSPVALTEPGLGHTTWVVEGYHDLLKFNWQSEKFILVADANEMQARINQRMCECMIKLLADRVS